MSAGARSFFASLDRLDRLVSDRLGRADTDLMIALLKAMILRLPTRNLMTASLEQIKTAGRSIKAGGRSPREMRLLQRGLTTFFDLAYNEGLITHHPIRRMGVLETKASPSALAVGLSSRSVGQVQSALGPWGHELEIEPDAARAVDKATLFPFHLIVSAYNLPWPGVEDLVFRLRARDSLSHHAGLVLTAGSQELSSARRLVGLGANRIVEDGDGGQLQAAFETLQRVVPRLRLKVPVRVVPDGNWDGNASMWQSENISVTGMLIRTQEAIDAGTTVGCAFKLPGDARPIRTRAEVVRQTHTRREAMIGIGTRFMAIEGDGERRLQAFISTQLHSR